jgi:predicted Zn-dependent peptidase
MKTKVLTFLLAIMFLVPASTTYAQKSKIKDARTGMVGTNTSEDGKFTYLTVSGDPLRSRIYTLKNGMTVYMTVNKNEPRIYSAIAVRTGSNNDPADATGLAHYLEHMLFKGTDRYGSLDYEKEKALLDQVEELYEKYRVTTDEAKRKELYAEIDRLSGEAAQFAIASEYDKMLSTIGAKGTNAFTSFEQTVYINDIPANQVEKWLKIESERFRNPVLRGFHTELEAVYEEKNISLDNDNRTAYFSLMETLFPTHNYGQQTTIGTVEHLKNPSIKKIKEYYNSYYVPNNMAICLSGDLDPDATIALIDKYFGGFKSESITPYNGPEEKPMTGIKTVEVTGPDAELLYMGFRVPSYGHEDEPVLEMIDYMLSNSTAGLIDLNLVKQQRVVEAWSSYQKMKDYAIQMLGGKPVTGQSLEQLRDLLLEQMGKIKKGDFDAALITSVINNMEIEKMREYEQNWGRTFGFVDAYVNGQDWSDHVLYMKKLRAVNRDDVIRVANKYYGENYAVVYKRTGERQDIKKVVKPAITPIEVNREAQSPFLKEVVNMNSPEMKPKFLSYTDDINISKLNSGVRVNYVKNVENKLFSMYYLLDFGKRQDNMMAMAIEYLPFLGTDKYSAEELSKKFYELGTSFDVSAGEEQTYVILRGLDKNFEQSVELFEHVLNSAKPDKDALSKLIDRTLKQRTDAKLNKRQILWRGMMTYGMYGKKNPFNNVMNEKEMRAVSASDLTDQLHKLTSYDHKVLYYGPDDPLIVKEVLNKYHEVPASRIAVPSEDPYTYVETETTKVYFVEYDMVQAEILWLSRSVPYDVEMTAMANLFNEYYGGNMSSIVFQTIRESKALAYSTFSAFVTPRKANDPYFVQAYVGTQADKLHDAVAGMQSLLDEMPQSDNLLENSRAAIKNKLETERIIRAAILFNYESALRMGLNRDIRKDVYTQIDNMDFETVQAFHKKYVADKSFNLLILGSKKNIDLKSLEQYGEVIELSLEDLFGY